MRGKVVSLWIAGIPDALGSLLEIVGSMLELNVVRSK